MKPPKPGIYEDVPFDEYCCWEAVNNSSLGPALKSTKHYLAHLATEREPTDALRFGSMAHNGVLEPTAILDRYVLVPDNFGDDIRNADGSAPKNLRATKAYKQKIAEFEAAHMGREVIHDRREYERLVGLVSAVRDHDRAVTYLTRKGLVECSMIWVDVETGLTCKGRMDHWSPKYGRITDLKTTRDAADFERSIARFGYDRQAAFYVDGLRSLGYDVAEFAIVAVESEAPFAVRAAPLHEDTLADGRELYRKALRRVAQYRQTLDAPGYDDPDFWRKPSWAFETNDETQLTLHGEALNL
jgi:hypothetical protein